MLKQIEIQRLKREKEVLLSENISMRESIRTLAAQNAMLFTTSEKLQAEVRIFRQQLEAAPAQK